MSFDLGAVGAWTDDIRFDVRADAVEAYAAATNDRGVDYVAAGETPPVFAVLPMWSALLQARDAVVHPDARGAVLHGEQDIHIAAPLRPGTTVRTRARVAGVQPKSSGTLIVIESRTTDLEDALLNRQFVTLFYRGVVGEQAAGDTAPGHALPSDARLERVAGVSVDSDQPARYADASGDRNPIHLDDAYARERGMPGVILHGLCSLAMVGGALVDAIGVEHGGRVGRLAVRFARPVLPGQRLAVAYGRLHDAGDAYGFRVENGGGDAVMTDGRLEVR